MSRIDIALDLARRGFCLLPQDLNKRPLIREWPERATTDEAQIRQWAQKWPKCNWAMVAGKSGLVVLDVDIKNNQPGLEELERLKTEHKVPETMTVRSGSGGLHLYFRRPPGVKKIKNIDLPGFEGIEIKGDGGAVTLPGALYADGREYTLLNDGEIAPCPDWLRDIVKKGSVSTPPARQPGTTDEIPAGQRNQTLTKLGGQLRRVGNDYEIIRASLLNINTKRCNPPLTIAEVDAIAKSVSTYDILNPLYTFRMSESGMVDRFLHLYGDQVFYVDDYKHWHTWQGSHWKKDNRRETQRRAHNMIIELYRLGMVIDDDDTRAGFMKFVASWDRISGLRNILEHASSDPKIAKIPDELDRNKNLFNTLSGTIELDTMTCREHRQSDYITRVAPVQFDPNAKCPTWQAFLDRVVPDRSVQVFLQQAVGYSLSGDTSEQCLFILYGTGANGKSTFLEVIAALLGDYASHTVVDTLLIKQGTQIPNDLAKLKGARFVYSMESESGKRLAESMVKALTGGDTVSARYLYGEWFSFIPEFKLWLGTNSKPIVRGQDFAIWRRIRLVPFEQVIPPEEQDKHMVDKLKDELPGILIWALEGCVDWMRNSLFVPECVRDATADYKTEMDILADFLASYCDVDVPDQTPKGDLYDAYKSWAEDNGERPLSQTKLGRLLKERGFQDGRTGKQRHWFGIRLKE